MTDIIELTERAFAPGGAVEKAFLKFGRIIVPNKEQAEYAVACAMAIDAGHSEVPPIALYEAATGIGKSLGYLVPLALSAAMGKRGVVATSTVQLQGQILAPGGDFDVAAEVARSVVKGRKITGAVRKGRRNFIDPSGFHDIADFVASHGLDNSAEFVANITKWVSDTKTGDLEEFRQTYGSIPDWVPRQLITAEGREESVFYDRHLEEADGADIVITNHALLLSHAKYWFTLLGETGAMDNLVVDEADRLPQAAQLLMSDGFPVIIVRNAIRRLPASAKRDVALRMMDKLSTELAGIFKRSDSFGSHFMRKENGSYLPLAGDNAKKERKRVGHILNSVVESLTPLLRMRDVEDRLVDETSCLRELSKLVNGDAGPFSPVVTLRWSPTNEYPSIIATSPRPAAVAGRLWSITRDFDETFFKSVIFTSASLSVPGVAEDEMSNNSVKSFAAQVGISKRLNPLYIRRFVPEKFGAASFVLSDPSAPQPTIKVGKKSFSNPEWLDHAAAMAKASCSGSNARVLALVTSFSDAAELADRLSASGVNDIYLHRRGVRLGDIIHDFKAAKRGILISPAAWEGVNILGLTDVVVTRIPFSPPGTLDVAVRENALRVYGHSEQSISTYILTDATSDALRKLFQGIARGIRQADQAVKIWICDPRFPLPSRLTSGHSPKYEQYTRADGERGGFPMKRFAYAIPARFREGVHSAYQNAEVFRAKRAKNPEAAQ